MNLKLFLNVPVKSLGVTIKFYEELGFEFDPNFTDEKSACMIINSDSYIMFLRDFFFQSFSKKEIPDTKNMAQCIIALMVDSKTEVDKIFDKALKLGANPHNYEEDVGSMYVKSFIDPDGYLIELFSE